MIETIIQNAITSQLQLTYTQHSCTATLTKICLQSHQKQTNEEPELREDEVWKLNKALCGYRKAPKLWHQHVVSLLECLSYHPILTDASCFRNDELNINVIIHVDDGLLFGPSIEILRLVELSSSQDMMRIVGRMERLGDQIFFLGRVSASWHTNPHILLFALQSGTVHTSPQPLVTCSPMRLHRLKSRHRKGVIRCHNISTW